MNGLRVFTNSESIERRGGCPIFYSRREDGPYYCWSYDDGEEEWQVRRVSRTGISQRILSAATWKTIPAGLKKSIVDHYEE